MSLAQLFEFSDLVHEINLHCDLHDRLHLAMINRSTWASRLFHGDHTGKHGKLQLSIEQQEVLHQLDISPKPYLILEGAASFGKTIITLLKFLGGRKPLEPVIASDRVLLVVPPRLVERWLEELTLHFPTFFDNDPMKSSVLIQAECCKKHHKLLQTYQPHLPLANHWRMMITTPTRVSQEYWLDRIPEFGWLVADEAQKIFNYDIAQCYLDILIDGRSQNQYQWRRAPLIPPIPRVLLLSANRINFDLGTDLSNFMNDDNTEVIVRSTEVVAAKLPDYEYHYLDSNTISSTLKTLFKSHSKIALFLHGIAEYEDYLKLEKKVTGLVIHQYKNALDPITAFNQAEGRHLLLVTYRNSSVGHNILAQAAVFDRPEHGSVANFHQALARLLRITNNTKKVELHLKCSDKILLHYKICANELKRKLSLDVTSSVTLFRVNKGHVKKLLDELELDYEQLEPLEFIWLCGPNVLGPKGKLRELFKQEGYDNDYCKDDIIAFYKKLNQ